VTVPILFITLVAESRLPMKKKLFYLFALSMPLLACNSGRHTDKIKSTVEELKGEWYKRYTGAIAGKPAIVNLHHFDGRTEGSYYFAAEGQLTNLEDAEETIDGYNSTLNEATSVNHTDRFDGDDHKPNQWDVNFRDNTIIGKLVSSDGKNISGIDLAERYGAGSYQPGVLLHGDSIQEKKGTTNTQAISYYQLLLPGPGMAGAAAAYLLATELHLLGGDTLGAKNLKEYIRKEDTKYFTKYKILLNDLIIEDRPGHADDWEYNFVHSRNIFVLYNDSGILSLAINDYDHSGGSSGQGIYISNYACVDMRGQKIWRLEDMINIDATRLQPLLEEEVRKMFKIGANDALHKTLTVDAVPLTESIFITGTGITFCYNPMVMGTDADGEIRVFLPYSKLGDLLKGDFKKRMGL
jgi:hypothetical protein